MAFQNAIYQALSNFGKSFVSAVDAAAARTQLEFTVTGSNLATAADQAAARTAIGLGTMATQNANAVSITGGSGAFSGPILTTDTTQSTSTTTGSIRGAGAGFTGNINAGGRGTFQGAWLGGKPLNDAYVSSNFYANGGLNFTNLQVVPTTERLQGSMAFGTVTSTNITNVDRIFNYSYESFSLISPGQTATIEIDVTGVFAARGGTSGLGYQREAGTVVCTFFHISRPTAFTFEIYARPQSSNDPWRWVTIASETDLDAILGYYETYSFQLPVNIWRNIQKIRITATARPDRDCRITAIEYFPGRPADDELPAYLPTKFNYDANIYCPSLSVRSPDHSIAATVGRGFFTPHSFTVAQLQAGLTGQTAGATAYCSNESGGAVPVFFDGTDWRRMTDRAVIS